MATDADTTVSTKPEPASAEDHKKPEKPDEEQFRAEVAQAEKEHAALMERLVSTTVSRGTCYGGNHPLWAVRMYDIGSTKRTKVDHLL